MRRFIILIFTILVTIIVYLYSQNVILTDKYGASIENVKAYSSQLSRLNGSNRMLKLTIEQLNYFNDSILQKMNDVRKELRIKDKDLKQMQYLLSEATKKDTIVFRDTLFREPTLDIDTIIGDKWYSIRLGLKYPNLITTNPTFISEKYIIVNKKKETINPPKKFFLFRWFQRKHWVMEVHIKEKNPYIKETNNKFVEIIE